MSFDWNYIVATYVSQPWWVWVAGCAAVWIGLKWLLGGYRAYREADPLPSHVPAVRRPRRL